MLVIDQDDEPDRHAALTEAQASPKFPSARRAFGVATKRFDAWVPADENSIASALGCASEPQKRPEEVDDPKAVCTSLRDGSGRKIGRRDLYADVGETADLDRLRERCPVGFAPFAERVAALAGG